MPTTYECEAIQNSIDPMGAKISLPCMWAAIFGYSNSQIGVAPAPAQSVWMVPPVSGVDAQQTVNALLDQQLVDQQAVNAGNVQSTWLDSLLGTGGGIADNLSKLPSANSLLLLVLGVVAVVVVMPMISDGGPRRYGR
jgi:hypothetical protein